MEPSAMYQNSGTIIFNGNAKLAETGNGGKTVCTLQKTCYFRQAAGYGAEHNSSVGNGLIAGNRKFPMKRMFFCEFHINHLSCTV